jgi:DNA (cytosine-5)-methyltransferase 1
VSLTAISLFTGAMGLDLGFEKHGFDIRVAVDNHPAVFETIRANRPLMPIIKENIRHVSTHNILKKASLQKEEATVVIGGPPCQPFSTAGRRLSLSDNRGALVFEFIRVVRQAKPRFFVFENVPGLRSATLRHISFYERVEKRLDEIPKESRLGEAFTLLLRKFRMTKYRLAIEVLDAGDYGAPQKRRRLFIMGARDGQSLEISERKRGCTTLRQALKGLDELDPEFLPFPLWGKYLKYVPPGGDWRDLPPKIQKEAMGKAFYSQGGRTGFFRRLHWDRPAPTLVSSPIRKATCLAHPDEIRPLSTNEYSAIQGFDQSWKFNGLTKEKYQMIGNAVPLHLSSIVGKTIESAAVDGEID